jgi:hypothetical protein
VFEGYLWKIKKIHNSLTKTYKIVDIFWYDSKNDYIDNDADYIVIAEPIIGSDDEIRNSVISTLGTKNHYLKYENNLWMYQR